MRDINEPTGFSVSRVVIDVPKQLYNVTSEVIIIMGYYLIVNYYPASRVIIR